MPLDQAKQLRPGTPLYHTRRINRDGTPQRFTVTSVKSWKRSPDRVRVRAKRGLREHIEIDQYSLWAVRLTEAPTNG